MAGNSARWRARGFKTTAQASVRVTSDLEKKTIGGSCLTSRLEESRVTDFTVDRATVLRNVMQRVVPSA